MDQVGLKEIYNILEIINKKPFQSAKEDLVKQYLQDPLYGELFKKIIKYAINLNITIPDVSQIKYYICLDDEDIKQYQNNDDIFKMLDFIKSCSGKDLTSEHIEFLGKISSINQETVEVVSRILNNDLHCGITDDQFKSFLNIKEEDEELEVIYSPEDITELETQLETCLEKYEEGSPIISDDEYDHYKRILQKLKPESYFLQKIGNVNKDPKKKVEELPYILGSLTNKFEEESGQDSIYVWLYKYNNNSGFVLSHKLDGVALEVEYTNGQLTGAWLRGNHYEGENILHKARYFVPNSTKVSIPGKVYLKGEVLLNCEPETIGYKTKRNAAAGIINRDDTDRLKYLYIIFHTFVPSKQIITNITNFELNRLEFIKDNLFNDENVVRFKYVENIKDVVTDAKKLIEEETQYDKDGIVITINDSEIENIKIPERKIAFKFNKMSAESEVIDVEFETTRTGKIVPVVIFKPVILGKATIQRATGFHAKFIYDNLIGPGAIVKIVRSGDVIPYIDEVVKKSTNIKIITKCPSCGHHPLVTDETKTHLYCTNKSCFSQIQKKVAYFFEKLGLENFSERMISTLGCSSIIDVFNLKKEDILKIDGWGETSATDFLQRIHSIKYSTPEKLLAGLSIENLGTSTAKLLLEYFTFEQILEYINDSNKLNEFTIKLIHIKGIGEKKVKTIIIGLIENKILLEQLILTGITFRTSKKGRLAGLSFCITGKLSKPRKDIEVLIEKNGGSNVSISSCQYLVCNEDSNSSKFIKAKDKGIKIITELDLIKMIK